MIGMKRIEAWPGAGATPGGAIVRPADVFVSPTWTLPMFLEAVQASFGVTREKGKSAADVLKVSLCYCVCTTDISLRILLTVF